MRRLLLCLLLALPAFPGPVEGRVTDGVGPLAGVRVYPDRGYRVRPAAELPSVRTDAEGRFRLDLEPGDACLAVEKEGYVRDLVPLAELGRPVVLRPAPAFRRERALVVRLGFPDEAPMRDDEALRRVLFGRAPGEASVASYLYEVSKGSLLLEEGAILSLEDAQHPAPRDDAQREDLVRAVLRRIRGLDLSAFDRVDNRSGALRPDGKPDHLWIVPPGPARNISLDARHLSAISFLMPLPWRSGSRWSVLFMPEDTPLGNFVHEAFHAMGEHRVDDLYLEDPRTAGTWDLMDAGQYRGWDRAHPEEPPYQEDTGYSPSQPMAWVRADLWYRGAFRATVPVAWLGGRSWEGWLDPLARAPGAHLQALRVADPRRKGHFWELSVRRPWGYDRGRVGGRFGPGHEGLVVAHLRPERLSTDGASRGPARVVDAHPGTAEPPRPRYPAGRWELDDAAFSFGDGGVARGQDGPLAWELLEEDAGGRMKVRVRLRLDGGRARSRR